MLELGILKTWNSTTYKAGVQLAGSLTTYLDDISVSVSIPSSAMVVGNYVLVAIPGGNPRDACVVASWPQGSSGGGGAVDKRFYMLADVTTIWRAWNQRVSSTPRTATVQGIASDVITLTGNHAYRLGDWGAAPEYMHASSVYVLIRNSTRGGTAWVKEAETNWLKVVTAGDISSWQNGDTVTTYSTSGVSQAVELDISPCIPDGATAVFLKTQAADNGTMAYAIGLQVSKAAASGTWTNVFCQATDMLISGYPAVPIQTNRHINVRDRATGTDTLRMQVSIVAYIK